MSSVTFSEAQRWYPGAARPAVVGIDLEVKDGEFMVLVGPSGCGKSTTLRMLAGLEDVTRGAVYIGDRDVTELPPKDRDIAMVFQNYALYPHMTAAHNMAFALKMDKMPMSERRERVAQAARMLGLTEYLDRKPKALSGGQRQRVAMGRAIVRSPAVFCMDEPLSNLDAEMRVQTRTDIAKLQRSLGVTSLYVTHDQVEAMTMGDRVAVMKDGVLQQVDTPLNLYENPANTFVAGFIGSPRMSLLSWKDLRRSHGRQGDGLAAHPSFDKATTIGIRPKDWRVLDTDQPQSIPARITAIERLGAETYVYASITLAATSASIAIRIAERDQHHVGEIIHVTADPADVHLFDDGGVRVVI